MAPSSHETRRAAPKPKVADRDGEIPAIARAVATGRLARCPECGWVGRGHECTQGGPDDRG